MPYIGYSVSVKGASHEKSGAPCQDSARVYCSDEISIAAVSDGHGSARHFRSASGSEMATRIAIRSVLDFFERNGGLDGFFQSDPAFAARRIAANIICGWNSEVAAHLKYMPLSAEEQEISEHYGGLASETMYGATLIVGAVLREGYFGLQIGDGSFLSEENGVTFMPMPEDERLVGTLTTSLCDSDAINSFRFVYRKEKCGALMLSSDGLINSFAAEEAFVSFGGRVMEAVARGQAQSLSHHLKERSKSGSRDDISIAVLALSKQD